MDDDQIARKLKDLRPLTDEDIRRLYTSNPSHELATAAWEIRRLHRFVLDAFNRYERGVARQAAASTLCHFGTQVAVAEPCVLALLSSDWLRRHEPGTRYHGARDDAVQPAYHVGWDPTESREPTPLPTPAPGGIRPANRSARSDRH